MVWYSSGQVTTDFGVRASRASALRCRPGSTAAPMHGARSASDPGSGPTSRRIVRFTLAVPRRGAPIPSCSFGVNTVSAHSSIWQYTLGSLACQPMPRVSSNWRLPISGWFEAVGQPVSGSPRQPCRFQSGLAVEWVASAAENGGVWGDASPHGCVRAGDASPHGCVRAGDASPHGYVRAGGASPHGCVRARAISSYLFLCGLKRKKLRKTRNVIYMKNPRAEK